MQIKQSHFKLEWIAIATAWWFLCVVLFYPWGPIRLDNYSLEHVRHCIFFLAIYPPLPILTVLIGTKWQSRFMLLTLVPMVLLSIFALFACFILFLISINYLGNSEQLKVLKVGSHRVGFYKEEMQSFKSRPYILIEDETPMFCGVHCSRTLDCIVDHSEILSSAINNHSFSYKVVALVPVPDKARSERSKDLIVTTYDFDTVPHVRAVKLPCRWK